jgi:hypothetical protein
VVIVFDRSALPPAETFYRQEFDRLPRPSRGWVQVRCCFHNDRRPSLSLNLHQGHFFCHSCGVKGGDVISFLMQRDGLSFRRACERLRAWTDGSAESQREMERSRRERKRLQSAAETIEAEAKRLRLQSRDYLHILDRIDREVSNRLQHDPQEDIYWQILSLLPDERRRATAEYYLLSFGAAGDRARYALNEDARENMLDTVLLDGFLRNESSYIEVPL